MLERLANTRNIWTLPNKIVATAKTVTQSTEIRPYPVRSPFWSRSTRVVECDCCFNHARTIVSLASHFCFTEKWKSTNFPTLSRNFWKEWQFFLGRAHMRGENLASGRFYRYYSCRGWQTNDKSFSRAMFSPFAQYSWDRSSPAFTSSDLGFFSSSFFCGRERDESKIKRELLNGEKNHFSR